MDPRRRQAMAAVNRARMGRRAASHRVLVDKFARRTRRFTMRGAAFWMVVSLSTVVTHGAPRDGSARTDGECSERVNRGGS